MKANFGFILFILSCITMAVFSIRLVAMVGNDWLNIAFYLVGLSGMFFGVKILSKHETV